MARRIAFTLPVLVGLLNAPCSRAQLPATRPAFEVASIKPSPSDEQGGGYHFLPGGRFTVTNFTLKNLIQVGWHLQAFRVAGGAAWTDSQRYDVEAKAEGNPSEDESRLMLQSLLADRFRLALRRETKELPIYTLAQAKTDGRLGAGIVAAKEGNCTTLGDYAGPTPSPEPGKPPGCGFTERLRPQDKGAALAQLQGLGVTLNLFARLLGNLLDRHVADETGVSGTYDVSLEYALDENRLAARLMPDAQPSDTTGPSLFTALQEQLGLKLESTKGPVEIFVIDHVERPSEN
jgi:uncharacterized protein (TIGR03435 family)